ncbi:hypothetical protein BS78_03G075100 [Paspalum vaginatum]|nr:hypothetical protein BS78_03G075100 [Paspalum vaginatum]
MILCPNIIHFSNQSELDTSSPSPLPILLPILTTGSGSGNEVGGATPRCATRPLAVFSRGGAAPRGRLLLPRRCGAEEAPGVAPARKTTPANEGGSCDYRRDGHDALSHSRRAPISSGGNGAVLGGSGRGGRGRKRVEVGRRRGAPLVRAGAEAGPVRRTAAGRSGDGGGVTAGGEFGEGGAEGGGAVGNEKTEKKQTENGPDRKCPMSNTNLEAITTTQK